MNRAKFLHFVKEVRELMPHATSQQKIRLITALKEGFHQLQLSKKPIILAESDIDYLTEK